MCVCVCVCVCEHKICAHVWSNEYGNHWVASFTVACLTVDLTCEFVLTTATLVNKAICWIPLCSPIVLLVVELTINLTGF